MEMENVVMLERDHPIIQELTADGKEITGIKIRVYTETNLDLYSLKVVLRDKDSGEVLYESEGDTYGLKENTALYSFLKHSVEVENGKTYQLEIATDAPQNSGIGLYCVTAGKSRNSLSSRTMKSTRKNAAFRCVLQELSKRAGNFYQNFYKIL